jgi:zinc transporter, ZIP family
MSAYSVLGIAVAAALASPLGGLIALWVRPTTFFMSLALGFASGVLLATISLEMVPQALTSSSLMTTMLGFIGGFIAVYGLDLFINRGRIAGRKAAQWATVRRFHRRHRPRGDQVTVLAGGTSAEELIEGLSIGVGAAIEPGLGFMVGAAIVIDNIAEALSIGELIRDEGRDDRGRAVRRILKWTGLIGVSLLSSAFAGWFALRGLPPSALGFLFAAGGGGMFYLTVTDLVPEAEERHYQQSAALAIGAGFIAILALGHFA